jgi:hypothetical protein
MIRFSNPSRRRIFLFEIFHTFSGVHPASYVKGAEISSRGVKWLRLEVYHSRPSSAEVENE